MLILCGQYSEIHVDIVWQMYQKNAEVEKERYEKKMYQWERRMMEIGRADLMRRKSQLQSGKMNAAGKASKADSKPV